MFFLLCAIADEAYVGKGDHVKRTSVHGRGRSGVRLRYRAHLTVSVGAGEREAVGNW